MKIKYFFPFLVAPILVTPFLLSSCSGVSSFTYDVTMDDFQNNREVKSLSHSSASLKKLLWGDSNFHHGNYLLIIANSTDANARGVLGSSASYDYDTNNFALSSTSVIKEGLDLFKSSHSFKTDDDKDIGIVLMFDVAKIVERHSTDIDDSEIDGASHPKQKTITMPFDKYNKYDQDADPDNDDVKEGNYVLTDSASKDFRNVIEATNKILNIGISEDKKAFLCMEWIHGYPCISPACLTSSSSDTFSNSYNMSEWFYNNYQAGINW